MQEKVEMCRNIVPIQQTLFKLTIVGHWSRFDIQVTDERFSSSAYISWIINGLYQFTVILWEGLGIYLPRLNKPIYVDSIIPIISGIVKISIFRCGTSQYLYNLLIVPSICQIFISVTMYWVAKSLNKVTIFV